MPYDDKGRFWVECRDGEFTDGVTCYKPPPDYEDEPPPPMPYGEEEVD